MLNIGSFQARTCGGISRRAFLQAGAVSPFLMGLPQAVRATEGAPAKSVMLVWLWGAPSHLDTVDPKPHAPAEYRGPFSTIATRTPSLRFTELLPRLAQHSDQFSLIRSNRNFHPGHLEAGSCALTGTPVSSPNWEPNFGSIAARRKGYGQFPPFVAVGRGAPRDVVGVMKGYGGGTWGQSYDPFQIECSELGEVNVPSLNLLEGLLPQRLSDRRTLLTELDTTRRRLDGQVNSGAAKQWNHSFERAYQMLTTTEARRALDLGAESPATRDNYGQTAFGQSLLLGRRLVEAGVPYVQVNWSQYVEAITPNTDFGWDTHIYNFESLADRHCPIFDRAFCALLDDLRERGLLETTLVVCMGEFGRTPQINNQAARDHWPNVYFSLWAGGGVQPGRVIGESDPLGREPITEPITPVSVGTTMLELCGINTEARAELRVLDGGRVIHELL